MGIEVFPFVPFLYSQKYKSARKIAYKGASLLAIYKAHLVRVRTRQIITMTDLMLMTRVWRFKATTVARDFSKCHTTVDSRCPFPGIVSNWLFSKL